MFIGGPRIGLISLNGAVNLRLEYLSQNVRKTVHDILQEQTISRLLWI